MRMSPRRLVVSALCLLLAAPALAELKQTGEAKVNFLAVGPAGFKINGKGDKLDVKDDGTQLTLIVPIKSLDTGIDLRNNHLRDKYIEVDKHPNAELTVPWSEIQKPAEGASAKGKAKGKMLLHGKTKDVSFTYDVARTGDTYRVKGNVPIDIRDYDIKIPSYLGVTVKPNVDVNVEFDAKDS